MGEAKYCVGGTWRTGIPQRMRHSGEEMGEAKAKLERRKAHAEKIVAAFERFIVALRDHQEGTTYFTRKELIDILVTPPPKQ